MFLHTSAEKTTKWFEGWALEALLVIPVLMACFLFFVAIYDWGAFLAGLAALAALSPLWLPVLLGVSLWTTWVDYIRFIYWSNFEKVLLEIQLPPEVEKSPLAVELVFNGIYNNGSETSFLDRFWRGKFIPIWSFEIASNEGRIGFYIHTPKGWKNFVTSRIYGQFPEAKITEVPDYTARVDFNSDEYDAWVGEYRKTSADKTQAYPIKTYIDYELDKNPDTPETKVDPMTHLLEIMNGIGKDEYLWMQIIVKARKGDAWYGIYSKKDSYKESAEKEIKAITESAIKRAQELTMDEMEKKKVGTRGAMLLTEGERSRVEAIERSLGKPLFEFGVRAVYFAKKERFVGITGAPLFRFFEPYRSPYTELRGVRGMVGFDYPWEDLWGMRKRHIKKQQISFFKNRAYFYVPYDQVPVFLTTEELASLWHFPSSVVKTPGLDRVSSRRAEAPSNLPVLPS